MILNKIKNIVKWVVVLFFSTTILAVVAYRFIPVYVTPLMFIRCFQQVADGESITLHHHWVSMDKISPHMPVAVMASEDARFLKHHGFDFNAIESAAKNNARGGKVHGASTISQQTAKNVFLWPGRSWTRKGAYLRSNSFPNRPFFSYGARLIDTSSYPVFAIVLFSISSGISCSVTMTVSPLEWEEVTFFTGNAARTASFI